MSCSICFDDITDSTGHVQMSCKHTFHFSCLTKWFGNQVMKDLPETCPCCRREANEHEGLPEEFDEEAESDSESESEPESEPDSVTDINAVMHFVVKRATLTEDELKAYAATRIQTAWRAYLPRMAWIQYKMALEEEDDLAEQARTLRETALQAERHRQFLKKSMTISRTSWRSLCANKIQALWRGHAVRRKMIRLVVNWNKINGVWTRRILRCIETWRVGLPPQSLAFQRDQSAKRIQSLWRGYIVRKVWKRHDGKGVAPFSYALLDAVIRHLGGTPPSYKEFLKLPPLNKEAFRDLCALNGAKYPSEIDWREIQAACDWIPKRLEEENARPASLRNTFILKISYSGVVRGWSMRFQYCQKASVIPAAVKIQAAWRGYLARQ